MNYEQIEAKIQKNLNGEAKPPVPIIYDPVSAHHKFDKREIALRSVYKQIEKGTHQIFDRELSCETIPKYYNPHSS